MLSTGRWSAVVVVLGLCVVLGGCPRSPYEQEIA